MSAAKFECITQYSDKFNELISEDQKGKNFCSFFSLITIYNFLNSFDRNIADDTSKTIHESNIGQAIMCHIINDIGNQLFFEDLLKFTDLNKGDIMATSVELIKHNI